MKITSLTIASGLGPLLMVLAAPLVTGFIRKLKASLQNRPGAPVTQPYRDLLKFFNKEETVSETSSWVLRAVPYAVFGGTLAACMLVPVVTQNPAIGFAGDLIVLAYLLVLPRIFMALGGLDCGSAFGGMGSAREMMVSSIAEPALILALLTPAVAAKSTQAGEIVRAISANGWQSLSPGWALAFAALFLVALAECARVPVDNPATHLELTMIHEAMILEHSGKSLAVLEWGSWLKLTLFLTLLANMFFPYGLASEADAGSLIVSLALYAVKVGFLCIVIALVESSMAKLRLFRVPDFLGAAFALALLGLLAQGLVRIGL